MFNTYFFNTARVLKFALLTQNSCRITSGYCVYFQTFAEAFEMQRLHSHPTQWCELTDVLSRWVLVSASGSEEQLRM